jgi:choloylglycine hydrolase
VIKFKLATLDEVKHALPEILVANVIFAAWKSDVPLHYIIYDTKGKSLVIEYVKGKLNIYDNPIGVLTNSPGFEWHLTNLRNYINISPKSASDQKIKNKNVSQRIKPI